MVTYSKCCSQLILTDPPLLVIAVQSNINSFWAHLGKKCTEYGMQCLSFVAHLALLVISLRQ